MQSFRSKFILLPLFVALFGPLQAHAKDYNVLFIAVDDLRPELASYGSSLSKTPNLDRFAKRSLQFNRAYCQYALCNPSRASLLSGRRPESLRVFELKTFVRDQNPDVITLPQLFKQSGYQSRSIGKIFHITNGNHEDPESWSEPAWHSPRDDAKGDQPSAVPRKKKAANPGKDPHEDEFPYSSPDVADNQLIDGQIADKAVQVLREIKDKPFFLAVGFHRPHLPFVAPKKYWDLYASSAFQLPTNRRLPQDAPPFASNDASELRRYKGVPDAGPISDEETLKLIHGYHASVSFVDAQIGKLLHELDALNLRDNTVVVLWGDHGYHLGEQGTWNKRTNWEVAARVPLYLSVPKTPSAKTDALVELVDLYPTLAELSGLKAPPKLEGTSLVPLLKNPEHPWKRAAFTVYSKKIPQTGEVFGTAMRTDRYRYIEWKSPDGSLKARELYDHKLDPLESTNVAGLKQHDGLVSELSQQLKDGWRAAQPKR